MSNQKHSSGIKGFLLVELGVALIFIGLLSAAYLSWYKVEVKKEKSRTTNDRLAIIQQGLLSFYTKHNRFPCPAATNDDTTSKSFNRETACGPGSPKPSGVRTIGSSQDGFVIAGRVPTRTIGISDPYSKDSWGGDFLYVVTLDLTTSNEKLLTSGNAYELGKIQIVDGNGQALGDTPSLFLLISYGQNKMGDFSRDATFERCKKGSYEEENCDDDTIFLRESYSESEGKYYFDDILVDDKSVVVAQDKGLKNTIEKLLHCQNQSAFYDPSDLDADTHGCIGSSMTTGQCPSGQVLGGIASTGEIVCVSRVQTGFCPSGGILMGYDEEGKMICNDTLIKIQSCAQMGLIYAGAGHPQANANGCIYAAKSPGG